MSTNSRLKDMKNYKKGKQTYLASLGCITCPEIWIFPWTVRASEPCSVLIATRPKNEKYKYNYNFLKVY